MRCFLGQRLIGALAACLLLFCNAPRSRAPASPTPSMAAAWGLLRPPSYSFNANSPALTQIAQVKLNGTAVDITGIGFDPLNGMLYGVTNNSSNFTLVTINTANAVATGGEWDEFDRVFGAVHCFRSGARQPVRLCQNKPGRQQLPLHPQHE